MWIILGAWLWHVSLNVNWLITTTTTTTTTNAAAAATITTTSAMNCVWQGIKFKVIGPPSSQDVIDACAKDAVRYTLNSYL